MTNVAKDVYDIYPPPPPNRVWGHIRLRGGHLCWDTKGATSFVGLVQLDICSEQNLNQVKQIKKLLGHPNFLYILLVFLYRFSV